jgi:hypothetical protein
MIPFKGVLVYATGKVEVVDNPTGKNYVKHCAECGSRMLFEGQDTMAEDQATVQPAEAEKHKRLGVDRARLNGGAVVYIQRPEFGKK